MTAAPGAAQAKNGSSIKQQAVSSASVLLHLACSRGPYSNVWHIQQHFHNTLSVTVGEPAHSHCARLWVALPRSGECSWRPSCAQPTCTFLKALRIPSGLSPVGLSVVSSALMTASQVLQVALMAARLRPLQLCSCTAFITCRTAHT